MIDTGFGSDADETERVVVSAVVPPGSPALIVNTHYDSDHVRGDFRLQPKWQTPIAADEWDARLINGREADIGGAAWARSADRALPGHAAAHRRHVLERGGTELTVIAAPGHTRG